MDDSKGSKTTAKVSLEQMTGHPTVEFKPWHGDVCTSFSDVPWAARLLHDPAWDTFITQSRDPRFLQLQGFFSHALATPDLIKACVMQRIKPPGHPLSASQLPKNPYTPHFLIPEVRIFFLLGSHSQGHPGVAHGGIVATMLDEVQGSLLFAAYEYLRQHHERPEDAPVTRPMTLNLEVKYRRAVPAPGTILARAWMEKVDGRKIFTNAVLEDGLGNVLSEGSGMFWETLQPVERAAKI